MLTEQEFSEKMNKGEIEKIEAEPSREEKSLTSPSAIDEYLQTLDQLRRPPRAVDDVPTDEPQTFVESIKDYLNGTTYRLYKWIGGAWKIVYDSTNNFVSHSLATAANDFLVASGAGVFVKKTLAEVKTILGLGTAAYTAATDYVTHALATAANDFLVASGSGTFVKKTLAETLAILTHNHDDRYYTETEINADIPRVLYSSFSISSHSGDNNETTLKTYSLPAGTLVNTNGVRITAFVYNGGATSVNFKIYFADQTVAVPGLVPFSDTAGSYMQVIIYNTGTATAQRRITVDSSTGQTGTPTTATFSVDTTVNVVIKVTAAITGAGGTAYCYGFLVEYLND